MYVLDKHIGMTKVTFVAHQTASINLYKNLRSKMLKFRASIYFNKKYLIKKVTPKYANIKFANTSPASQVATKKVQGCVLTDILYRV